MNNADETKILNLLADIRSLIEQRADQQEVVDSLKSKLEFEEEELRDIKADLDFKRDNLDDLISELTADERDSVSYDYRG